MSDVESVQQELQEYLQRKGINTLFISIVESLLLAKPDNPIQHIITYLQTKFPDQCLSPSHDANVSTVDSAESSSEEDDVGDIHVTQNVPKLHSRGRRTSVSAETMDPERLRNSIPTVVHPKSDKEKKHIRDIINGNILFKHLDENQMMILVDAMFLKRYEKGEVIIRQGDDGDNFYVLDSGICEVFKDNVLVQTVTEAMSFGELALMYNAPRAATVTAKDDVRVWAMDRVTFKNIIMDTTVQRRDQHMALIEKVPLLESLSDVERCTVTDALKSVTFGDGEVIIQQGDPGNMFYIIEEGYATCTKQPSSGEPPQPIGELGPGSYFGEIALLTSRPRQATVIASGSVKCLSLDRRTFKRVMGPLEDILKRNMERYNTVIANTI